MTDQESEIIILGGGCIGASIAAALLRAGHKGVQLVDSERVTNSSTAASGGMIRVFHERQEHMELAHRSNKIEAEFDLGPSNGLRALNSRDGHLYFFEHRRLSQFQRNLEWMKEQGIEFELLSAKIGREKFPNYSWGQEDWAVYEPSAGHRNPQQFTDSLLNFAIKKGLIIHNHTRVSKICNHLDRFRLVAGHSSFSTKTLVLAGGYQMLPLLQDLKLNLQLERKEIRTFRMELGASEAATLQGPNYFDRESLEYGRLGLNPSKIFSAHRPARITNFASAEVVRELISYDSYSPERSGYLGEISGRPNLFIATGWGGTGFKFALEVGHRIAKAVAQRPYSHRGQYAVLS